MAHPHMVFPFGMDCPALHLGEECMLHPLETDDLIRVSSVTSTSFTFTVVHWQYGDPEGSKITFSILSWIKVGDTLQQHGYAPSANLFVNLLAPAIALQEWAIMADRLNADAVQVMRFEGHPNSCYPGGLLLVKRRVITPVGMTGYAVIFLLSVLLPSAGSAVCTYAWAAVLPIISCRTSGSRGVSHLVAAPAGDGSESRDSFSSMGGSGVLLSERHCHLSWC